MLQTQVESLAHTKELLAFEASTDALACAGLALGRLADTVSSCSSCFMVFGGKLGVGQRADTGSRGSRNKSGYEAPWVKQ